MTHPGHARSAVETEVLVVPWRAAVPVEVRLIGYREISQETRPVRPDSAPS
jgi:hypothetical protein